MVDKDRQLQRLFRQQEHSEQEQMRKSECISGLEQRLKVKSSNASFLKVEIKKRDKEIDSFSQLVHESKTRPGTAKFT